MSLALFTHGVYPDIIILGRKVFFVLARWEKTDAQSKRADRGCITAGRSRLLPALTKSAIHIIEKKILCCPEDRGTLHKQSQSSHQVVQKLSQSCFKVVLTAEVRSTPQIISSVRSSYSHPDLLLITSTTTTPLFQITPVLNTGLSLSEPVQLYKGYNAI